MTPASHPATANGSVAIGDEQLRAMAAAIRAEIPDAEVRLFGSRARGEGRSDSDVDLLITAGASWLTTAFRWICSCIPAVRWRSAAVGVAIWARIHP